MIDCKDLCALALCIRWTGSAYSRHHISFMDMLRIMTVLSVLVLFSSEAYEPKDSRIQLIYASRTEMELNSRQILSVKSYHSCYQHLRSKLSIYLCYVSNSSHQSGNLPGISTHVLLYVWKAVETRLTIAEEFTHKQAKTLIQRRLYPLLLNRSCKAYSSSFLRFFISSRLYR